jgi:hypothetical protein
MSMVLDIEKKDKCQKSDLENALTGAVLKMVDGRWGRMLRVGFPAFRKARNGVFNMIWP